MKRCSGGAEVVVDGVVSISGGEVSGGSEPLVEKREARRDVRDGVAGFEEGDEKETLGDDGADESGSSRSWSSLGRPLLWMRR